MDLKSFIRRRLSLVPFSPSKHALDPTHLPEPSSSRPNKRPGSSAMRLTKILALCSVSLPILFVLSLLIRHPPSDPLHSHARVLENLPHHNSTRTHQGNDLDGVGSLMKDKEEEKLLGGLLAAGFDDSACLSRYRKFLYKKNSIYNLSSYLVSRLRRYEDLHRKCGPGTEMYNVGLEQIRSGKRSVSSGSRECKYVVWISFSGLGNRILSLVSTFLYALLTDRVLLVDRGKDMADLFCEPFPGNSWLLPTDFPLADKFGEFDQNSDRCYGNMLKSNVIKVSEEEAESSIPSYLYLHLVHDYGDHDKLFFCEGDQSFLAKVPWLIAKTDNYFVPSLFLIDSFDHELSKLFPKKGTVFHHLGRYLFHPSNAVWGLIARYYHTHMANADERIGLQIRVFDSRPGPFKHVIDQILACTIKEKLLPEVQMDNSDILPSENPKMKSVLVTSLNSGYSEILSNMYWENPTKTGEVVAVFQPSHEEYQQTEKQGHNRKALAEMYLLSMTDVLVTSSWSTFGYVAQGLGGLKPWILYKPENDTTPDPPCRRAMSMEPCFHAPPFYDCKERRGTDTGALVPHVRHCEDMSWGLKVVDGRDEL